MQLNVLYTDASLCLYGFVHVLDNGMCFSKEKKHEVSIYKVQTCLQNVRFYYCLFRLLTLVLSLYHAQFGLQTSSVQL